MTWLWDLLFPAICLGCGAQGAWLCSRCLAQETGWHQGRFCILCRVSNDDGNFCDTHERSNLKGIIAVTDFHPGIIREAVHQLKYSGQLALASPLGSLLAERIKEQGWSAALLVPVPMHRRRLIERGYNQAAYIAKITAKSLAWPYSERVVSKAKATASQATLDRAGRLENLKGSFRVNPEAVSAIKDKKILLVDDVTTTGSTLNELAFELLKNGAKEVRAAVIAVEK